MNRVTILKSFTYVKSATPTLIGTSILTKGSFKGCKVSVYQARLEAKIFFDKIRKWNRRQREPPREEIEPDLLVMEMALT